MPRKKRMPGAHFEWDFVNGPRGRSLSAVEWTLYSKLWALATHERRKIVCRLRYDCTYLADFLHIDPRTLRKLLADLEQKCCKNAHLAELLEVTDHYIKVNGVQEKQDWLTWKEPLPCCSLHVPSRSTKTSTCTKTKTHTKGKGVKPDALFDEFWKIYPERLPASNRPSAEKAWSARMKQGADPQAIIIGAQNYAAERKQENAIKTKFVKMAATFLGPSKHWEEFQKPVKGNSKTGSKGTDFDSKDYSIPEDFK